MIQVIGLMVALYIITRMFHLIIDKHKETGIVTLLFALLTIIIAVYGANFLFTSGSEITKTLSDFSSFRSY